LALFSAFGCWFADMLVYPFDTIATRIKANKKIFRSFNQELSYIFKKEDVRSLYRGFSSTFSCAFVPSIVYFLVYENLNKCAKEYLKTSHPETGKLKYMLPLVTGPFSEMISLLIYLPFDIVRTRLQVNFKEFDYKGITHGIRYIIEREGLLRIYKSSGLYMVNTCCYVGLQMWFYEAMRSYLLMNYHTKDDNRLTLKESLMTSVCVTATASVLVNPLDVLFTRYQIVDAKKEVLSVKRIAKDLIKNEGKKGFFKGTGAKVIGNGTLAMVWLPIYDYFKSRYGVDLYD